MAGRLVKRMNTERNYGIDLLRIVSMLMVVILHINGQGGLLKAAEIYTPQYYVIWFIEVAVFCGVNCYGLISGYVGADSKFKFSSLAYLWMRVVFYTLGITLVFAIMYPGKVGLLHWIKALFPVMFGQYWYFTAYFALFFAMPMLNYYVNTATKRHIEAVLISGVVVFSILPTLFHVDSFGTYGGCSVLWLLFLYIMGAYIKKYGLPIRKNYIFIYMIVVCLVLLSKVVIEGITESVLGKPIGGGYLISYTSPMVLLMALALVMFFSEMQMGAGVKKVVASVSPLAFSVYLIHTHPLVWENMLTNRFANWIEDTPILLVTKILIGALGIFGICIIIDSIRDGVFVRLKVKERLANIENKVLERVIEEDE